MLILVSDCPHDASPVPPPDLVKGVEVLVVAGGRRPPLRRVTYFEGVAAAIAHVTREEDETANSPRSIPLPTRCGAREHESKKRCGCCRRRPRPAMATA